MESNCCKMFFFSHSMKGGFLVFAFFLRKVLSPGDRRLARMIWLAFGHDVAM
jgi:hypothetical protein